MPGFVFFAVRYSDVQISPNFARTSHTCTSFLQKNQNILTFFSIFNRGTVHWAHLSPVTEGDFRTYNSYFCISNYMSVLILHFRCRALLVETNQVVYTLECTEYSLIVFL